jgi:hypothetical protein
MIRYLPILMLAFGLLLVSASFASARTPDAPRPDHAAVCVDVSAQSASLSAEPAKLGRCWKQMGLGILIPGCQVHAELARIDQPAIPDGDTFWPVPLNLMGNDGPPARLDIPPPRA